MKRSFDLYLKDILEAINKERIWDMIENKLDTLKQEVEEILEKEKMN